MSALRTLKAMQSRDISALISRTALRDRTAFADLYRHTSAKLFGVTLRILGNRHDAEEALQEIYVKIWQRADRYAQDSGNPISWLSAIARNHAIDIRRARAPEAHGLDAETEIANDAPSPAAAAMGGAELRRIGTCLGELEPKRAEAVWRAYVEGYSYRELASRFRVPLNTMRTWLRRSLMNLRTCLER